MNSETESPATVLSGFTGFTPAGVQTGTPATEDQFMEQGTGLDTGISRQFKPASSQPSPKSPQQPRPVWPRSPREERLARITEWVDTSGSAELAMMQAAAESLSVQSTPPADRKSMLRNLHERGMSIDNLAIPWLKDSEMMEEEERRLAKAMGASKRPMGPTRFKSVGKVVQKSTPTPMHNGITRASTHLEPIIIPPKKDNMPEIEQPMDYGSLESTSTGKGVLRDSEVLGMADGVFVKQHANTANKSNYF